MIEKCQGDNAAVHPNATARQIAKPESEHRRRSLAILIALALVGLGLIVLPRPPLYYPNVVIDAVGGTQFEYLLIGRQDKAACETAAASIASAFTASCHECRIRSQTCITNPPAELRRRFDETPLPIPSTRMADGIVTYSARQVNNAPDLALLACRENERQAAVLGVQAKVTCYPAGATRPRNAFEKHRYQAAYSTFTLLLAIVGGFVVTLSLIVLITHARHERQIANPIVDLGGVPRLSTHRWLEKFILAGVDTLILLGTALALGWPTSDDISRWNRLDRTSVIAHGLVIAFTICWFWMLLEHYARRRPFWDELREIFLVLTFMFMVSGAVTFEIGFGSGRSIHLMMWALNFLLIPVGRIGAKHLLDDMGLWRRPAIIIGCGQNARDAYGAIASDGNLGYKILAFLCPTGTNPVPPATVEILGADVPVIYDTQGIERTIAAMGNPHTIVALESLSDPASQKLVRQLTIGHVSVDVIPAIRGLPLFGMRMSHFFSNEVLLLSLRNNLSRLAARTVKRVFDLLGASVLLVLLGPTMLFIALWIRRDGGPALYSDRRVARDGGEFRCLKFRSMVLNADKMLAELLAKNSALRAEYEATIKLKMDPRITPVGAFLRRTSLDELPQLLNVLKGDMSLVGPRPMLPYERPKYGDQIAYYYRVRPGITGLWQVSGRNDADYSQRIFYVEWYVKNWSLWYDLVILLKTVQVVLRKSGAY